jgi:hypothetical protein
MIEKNKIYTSTAVALIFFYVISGLAVMILLSPQIPYADSWRFLAQLLELPFPQNILASDNGHREIIPNLIRLADLHWFSAAQSFQIFCGIAFALLTLGLFLRVIYVSQITPATKIIVILFGVLAIFWLGNIRILGHASEAIHAYLITACLIQGIALLINDTAKPTRYLLKGCSVGALGLIASFSFGSGIACFAAFYIVLAIKKSRWQLWLGVTLCFLLVIALSIFSGSTGSFIFSPFAQLNTLLSWISAPIVYAAWPLLDPAIAAQIPVKIIQQFSTNVSSSIEAAIGPVVFGPWPVKLISLTALILLLRETWLLRSKYFAIPMLGVAISWFSVAVGSLIAIGRYEYFLDNPEQVMAARYIVWSSWFWAGLGIAMISRKTENSRHLAVALFVSLALLPSQIWMAKLGISTKNAAEFGALAVALDAYNSDTKLGENIPAEMSHILPELKNRKAGIFLWPEMNLLNDHSSVQKLIATDAILIKSEIVINMTGDEWQELTVVCKNCENKNLLVLNQKDEVIGLVRKMLHSNYWIGWAKTQKLGDRFRFVIME